MLTRMLAYIKLHQKYNYIEIFESAYMFFPSHLCVIKNHTWMSSLQIHSFIQLIFIKTLIYVKHCFVSRDTVVSKAVKSLHLLGLPNLCNEIYRKILTSKIHTILNDEKHLKRNKISEWE